MPLSLPIVCVALGYGFERLGFFGTAVDYLSRLRLPEIGAQIVVLIALMGAGLKIDRRFAWRSWATTWRLLGIGMPLMILTTTLLAAEWAGFSWPAALLIAAMLAPTDPVLASDVEVGPPGKGEEGEVRFGLTPEAGLNDGLAFPFVNLAIGLASGTLVDASWLGFHFVLKMALSLGCGWLLGQLFGMLVFRLPRLRISNTGDGLAALGITLLSFVLTEAAGGYGFVAVFITALAARAAHWDSDFNRARTDFASQVERLLAMMVLVLFGAALAMGNPRCAYNTGCRPCIRSTARRQASDGLVGSFEVSPPDDLARSHGVLRHPGHRHALYPLYAMNRAEFEDSPRIVALVCFVVLSILLHGLTSTPVMEHLDRARANMERNAQRRRNNRA